MIVIAGRLSLLGFVFKPVSWLAGDSRLRQTFSLRISLVERQSLSPICPSTIISYNHSLEASLSTSASRPIASPIVFSLDRNKPVTESEWPMEHDPDPNSTACTICSAADHAYQKLNRYWIKTESNTGQVIATILDPRMMLLLFKNLH